jgi:hypothetical protein
LFLAIVVAEAITTAVARAFRLTDEAKVAGLKGLKIT